MGSPNLRQQEDHATQSIGYVILGGWIPKMKVHDGERQESRARRSHHEREPEAKEPALTILEIQSLGSSP